MNHGIDVQLAGDVARRVVAALVAHDRSARDHAQRPQLRQVRRQQVRHPVAEVVLACAREVLQRQDGQASHARSRHRLRAPADPRQAARGPHGADQRGRGRKSHQPKPRPATRPVRSLLRDRRRGRFGRQFQRGGQFRLERPGRLGPGGRIGRESPIDHFHKRRGEVGANIPDGFSGSGRVGSLDMGERRAGYGESPGNQVKEEGAHAVQVAFRGRWTAGQ